MMSFTSNLGSVSARTHFTIPQPGEQQQLHSQSGGAVEQNVGERASARSKMHLVPLVKAGNQRTHAECHGRPAQCPVGRV